MSVTNIDQLSGDSTLFAGLSKKELKAIGRLLTPVKVPQGTVLTREGDLGREAMFIASGTASVERDGMKVATLGPGEFFGELALLTGARRMAMVTADTDMVVAALSRQEFASLLDTSPTIAQKILVDAVRRLHDNAA
ncbi:MAG: cyclic nucleotide-binding domain-containing protein [Acidimicrobiales bacterium]